MKQDDPIQRALTTVRLQGQLLEKRDDAVVVRRGASVFQANAADVVEIKQTSGDTVEVLLKAGCTLIRSTAVQPIGRGRIVGLGGRWPGGVRADDCTECSDCNDCTECSDCECTDCSDCVQDCHTSDCAMGGGGHPIDCPDPEDQFRRPSSRWVRRRTGRGRQY